MALNWFKPKESKELAVEIKKKSKKLKSLGDLSVYAIPLKDQKSDIEGCNFVTFGKESKKENRTIMVLGATGAGKSTLLNGMINYILGVQWDDSYRFNLVNEDDTKSQVHSQTSEVTVYKLNHCDGFTIPFSLTIVDTPGFGDTRGIERDMAITEQIRSLFSDPNGVKEIDAICFVAQAALARLTPTQRYVFDSVLSIFGKDVAENIKVLITFADGQLPPVLQGITASGVPCPKNSKGQPFHFKFNNSALFASNKSPEANGSGVDDDDDEASGSFDKMFWEMGTKSMGRFFTALNRTETKSLTMTNEVLRERKQLENTIENLQKQIVIGMAKSEEIRLKTEKLKTSEAEIARNKNFKISVKVIEPYRIDISGSGRFLTNCQQCHHTCHDNCAYANDKDKHKCCAMGSNGYCTVCPSKCYWNVHFNQKYQWGYREVTKEQTVDELLKKYNEASEEKLTVQELCDKLKWEYDNLQSNVMALVEQSASCLTRLKEIALKPSPLTTPDYIDMLIEGEKSEKKTGFQARIASLMSMREKAELNAKVEKGQKLL